MKSTVKEGSASKRQPKHQCTRVAQKEERKARVVAEMPAAQEETPERFPKNARIKVYVVGWEGDLHLYRIKDCAWAMGRLKRKYARKCGMDPALIRLILNGRTVRDIECPLLLCLEDNDKVEVGWAY